MSLESFALAKVAGLLFSAQGNSACLWSTLPKPKHIRYRISHMVAEAGTGPMP